MLLWAAVCRQGTTGPIATLKPWKDWLPLDLHGFHKWVFDALGGELHLFVSRFFFARREAALLSWKRWLEEDLSSRPKRWLRPDLATLAPYLTCPGQQTSGRSGLLVQPALIDVIFGRLGYPSSGGRVRTRLRLLSLFVVCGFLPTASP